MSNAINTPREPESFSGPWSEAHDAARSGVEPVFVALDVHCDDRGWSLMNMLVGVMQPTGQLNYSVQHPGVVKAWHRHDHQTDFWVCLHGHIKAGVYREDGTAWSMVLGEKRPGVLIIPPPLFHGAATVGETAAGLLYYVTHAYDENHPDEIRRAWDSLHGFPWGIEHR